MSIVKLFCHGSKRDMGESLIYTKLIIVFTPNLEFFPDSGVIHGCTTFKLMKGYQRLKKKDQLFNLKFLIFLFLQSNVSDNKCYKQKWCMLFFTTIKQVVSVVVCVCNCTHQMEKIAISMWIPKRAMLIKGRHLFAAQCLLEEIQQ